MFVKLVNREAQGQIPPCLSLHQVNILKRMSGCPELHAEVPTIWAGQVTPSFLPGRMEGSEVGLLLPPMGQAAVSLLNSHPSSSGRGSSGLT